VAVIGLLLAAVSLLWNRHGPESVGSGQKERLAEPSSAVVSATVLEASPQAVSQPDSVPVDSAYPDPAGSVMTPPPPNYEAEEFTHVPDWIPRPGSALSAMAEDASLRSDGFVEGKVHLTFGADPAGVLGEIAAHLKAAGMSAPAGASFYASEDPPRGCEIQVEKAPDGASKVTLVYQGIDHEKGCLCPTCGKSPERPEP
jgi:hypothetical protein